MSSRLRVMMPIEINDPLPRSQTSGSFQTQKTVAKEVTKSTGGRILKCHRENIVGLLPPFSSKKIYCNSAEKIHSEKRGISKYFKDSGSELTLIHRVPKQHVREEVHQSQVIINILALSVSSKSVDPTSDYLPCPWLYNWDWYRWPLE